MSSSVLDDLGKEVNGVVAPVSLCMALTVALVKALNSDSDSSEDSVAIATAYYKEEDEDSTSKKLWGSVMNALIFVAFITILTFVLVLLFKYGRTNCIYVYMGFSLLSIFFFLTGAVIVELLREFDLHVDAVTLTLLLYNFSVVGALGLFFWTIPIVVKQGYLVVVGVVVAYLFAQIPEWSTWVLLVFMALYDICAVLIPGGPLKQLVELAMERGEDLPALVYEVRPTDGPRREWRERYQQRRQRRSQDYVSQFPVASLTAAVTMSSTGDPESRSVDEESRQTQETEETQLMSSTADRSAPNSSAGHAAEISEIERTPRQSRRGARQTRERASFRVEVPSREDSQDPEDDDSAAFMLPDSLKLGLGDFIFYSVLVGRAARYDIMTVMAAYLGIVAGLGLTLLLLALYRKALPALPFSIVLGLVFYFLTRLVLEPFAISMNLSLTLF